MCVCFFPIYRFSAGNNFALWETFGGGWRLFFSGHSWEKGSCYWHLTGRGRWRWASHKARDSPHSPTKGMCPMRQKGQRWGTLSGLESKPHSAWDGFLCSLLDPDTNAVSLPEEPPNSRERIPRLGEGWRGGWGWALGCWVFLGTGY